MPSLKDLKNRIASVKSTRKITKAMQMVAAAKLRRAEDAARQARPYAERFNAVMAGLAGSVARVGHRAAAARRDRQGGHAPSRRDDRRAGAVRRLQLDDRAAGETARRQAAHRGQDGEDPDRRQEGARAAAPRLWQPADRACRPVGRSAGRLRRRAGRRQTGARPVRRRRVRRRDDLLQPVCERDQPGADRATDHSRQVR